MTNSSFADWTPPENPNPTQILSEARSNASAGKHSDALAKYLWFHENALKYDRALYGVRLSFALSYWHELAEVYPPALEKLEAIQKESAIQVRTDPDAKEFFNDYEAINKELDEEIKTSDLFVWLDKNKPNIAQQVFDLAQPSLVKAKNYQLVSKYINAENSYSRLLKLYKEELCVAEDPKLGDMMRDYAQRSFMNGVAVLVGVLAITNRKNEATEIASAANKEWNNAEFQKTIQDALDGVIPTPWP